MAHFAQLDENNIVIAVLVVNNSVILNDQNEEVEQMGIDYLKGLFGENTRWVQTSYNGNFRGNYAGIGYLYDEQNDIFIPKENT